MIPKFSTKQNSTRIDTYIPNQTFQNMYFNVYPILWKSLKSYSR